MEQRRGVLARIGVTLLSLLVPGLGSLRLGRWKAAVVLFVLSLSLPALFFVAPPLPFVMFATLVVVGFGVYLVAMGMAWIAGRTIHSPRPWYSQWYVVTAAALGAMTLNVTLTDPDSARYRSFYTPAEGMAPTLPKGDRFFAYMRAPRELRRGDLLLIRSPNGSIYIKRLAALAGDRIALVNGVVMLNGTPIPQRVVSTELVDFAGVKEPTQRRSEQFPGEPTSHLVYDSGESFFDTVPEQTVRPGHVFVIGDNRDHSADSRVSREEMGLEQAPIADIKGWPLYHSFGSSRPLGRAINRRDME